jgi:hypothetical protein
MSTPTGTTAISATTFTAHERRALYALRGRYRLDRDLFSTEEVARLQFLRWLCQAGRLVP